MTQTTKEQEKRVTKNLKSLHDLLKKQKKISTRTEFLSFVEKAISENPLVRDFLSSGGRMGVFEPDFKEIFDSGKNPYTIDAGKTKTRADIIHAKEKIDNISIDLKYSNTVGQTKMYMTQYFSPGICSDRFHGYVRLSMPIECDGAVPIECDGGACGGPCGPCALDYVETLPLSSDHDGGAGQPNGVPAPAPEPDAVNPDSPDEVVPAPKPVPEPGHHDSPDGAGTINHEPGRAPDGADQPESRVGDAMRTSGSANPSTYA